MSDAVSDRIKRRDTYIMQLIMERANLQKQVRRIQEELLATQAQLARQTVENK